jgi:putative transcriptional regulator
VREFGSSSLSLAGSLLIAHPSLLDPNFCKTVLILSANDPEEGSFGVVLNRPAGRTVADVLPEQDLGKLGHTPVLVGGPVSSDQLIFAAFRWKRGSKRMECKHHLVIDEAHAALDEENTIVRAFIGYAGWSKGQLEAELAQHAWLVGRPDREIMGIGRTASLWRDTISGFGAWFRLVAEAPEDISRN